MNDSVADWSDEEIEIHYKMGHCHILALAISQATGLPLGIMWNGMDWHIEPDARGRGGVREVVHIYADCGDGDVIDASGRRKLDEMRKEFAPYEWEVCPCEALTIERLNELVHQSENLRPYGDDDIEEAAEVIRRIPVLTNAIAGFAAAAPAR